VWECYSTWRGSRPDIANVVRGLMKVMVEISTRSYEGKERELLNLFWGHKILLNEPSKLTEENRN
jgi:hypothetical protein